jgi:ATP-dependent Clp protease adaptor protein ClpS
MGRQATVCRPFVYPAGPFFRQFFCYIGSDMPATPFCMTDDDRDADGGGGRTGVGLATKPKTKTAKPALYKVLLLNDDYTPMEFVVLTLQRYFKMSIEDATRVMLHVHQRGVGVCGIFTYEVAETKVNQVMDFARQHQHPLQCTMEKE